MGTVSNDPGHYSIRKHHERRSIPNQCSNSSLPLMPCFIPTHKQLRTHETTKHNIRCMATLLTPTNGCPNCKTVFATRASAIHHLKNSMKKGYCVGHQAHNLKKLTPPANLQCTYCMALGMEQDIIHEDTERLHLHIKTSHLFDLPSQYVGNEDASLDEERPRKRVRRTRRKKDEGRRKWTSM